ncbi:LOW QUALITY PROTEIN: dnaJ homolog subfamily C member 28 [Notothenia coriiceps]|uniref:LOW QUALITY PROTEIN: dnaJ homolog subfamily C member 28 n=1 Tax=Notothenia coriiceps TaxID=8208 RepID=A0A6I9NEN2_9TELE|nr:PREDICTED: LOW QUALITY PROTEIN: dnaJ homolog subfamily C member 28 [Notothenia coriiceps]
MLCSRVEEAYRAVLAHQTKTNRTDGGKQVEDEDNSRGKAFPHRHYLSYEGLGSGTPSQRERQYRQIRVDRASEPVFNYRQREHKRAAAAEGALIERDIRQRSRKIERLVEDMIQESMARGDFRNLSGADKPLRDIRETIAEIRNELLEERARLGDPLAPKEQSKWEQLCESAEGDLVKLNKMVDDYNLIVPMLNMQMVHFSLSREIDRAVKGEHQHRLDQQREREKRSKRGGRKRKKDPTQ